MGNKSTYHIPKARVFPPFVEIIFDCIGFAGVILTLFGHCFISNWIEEGYATEGKISNHVKDIALGVITSGLEVPTKPVVKDDFYVEEDDLLDDVVNFSPSNSLRTSLSLNDLAVPSMMDDSLMTSVSDGKVQPGFNRRRKKNSDASNNED